MSDAAQSLVFQGRCWAFLKLENFLGDGRKDEAELTKGCVKLLFCQVLVVIDVVVLEQVEQCALGDVLGQAFLLDNLEWEVSNVLLKRTILFFFFFPHLSKLFAGNSIYVQLIYKSKYVKYAE